MCLWSSLPSLYRYKNIIQLWTGCPPSGMWLGEGCLVIIWRTNMLCARISLCLSLSLSLFALKRVNEKIACFIPTPQPPPFQSPLPATPWPPPTLHADSTVGPSFPSHYRSCTQHIVISHCKHESPLNPLDYLLYRRRLDTIWGATLLCENGLCIVLGKISWKTFLWLIAQKWTRKEENLYLCNIYMILDIYLFYLKHLELLYVMCCSWHSPYWPWNFIVNRYSGPLKETNWIEVHVNLDC